MSVRATLDELVDRASLPRVVATRVLGEQGFDNELLVGVLADGRQVVLRQNSIPKPPPSARTGFLALHDVGAPRVHAANDNGAVLVEFVPGETLAALSHRAVLDEHVWGMVGEAYKRVHAVQFPAPLRGPFGPERLELEPCDPVELLHGKVDAVAPAVADQQPQLTPFVSRIHQRIDARAEELRSQVPCLVHSDANFHNIVVGADRVTLIDWDYPAVRYPLEELEALEEHGFLHGIPELPPAFFAGYGRQVSRELLMLHRIVGSLGAFSGEWSEMAADTRHPIHLRSMLRAWDHQLRRWFDQIEEHLHKT